MLKLNNFSYRYRNNSLKTIAVFKNSLYVSVMMFYLKVGRDVVS